MCVCAHTITFTLEIFAWGPQMASRNTARLYVAHLNRSSRQTRSSEMKTNDNEAKTNAKKPVVLLDMCTLYQNTSSTICNLYVFERDSSSEIHSLAAANIRAHSSVLYLI